ncbi:MAG TPA: di-heme oxidoredictase family protein [Burkholderiales bacterium]|nr:di-heme oxidoredictase family protein [Burkholderiales bacterium]
MKNLVIALLILALAGFFLFRDEFPLPDDSSSAARDPGPRGGAAGAGAPIAGLTRTELALFNAGKDEFSQEEEVADGLGPTMNLDSCAGCHLQPAVGGTSPAVNPQVAFATLNGATNAVPSFITPKGPVREARFVKNADGTPDGGVHDLFTIAGRADAPGCVLAQPDFERELARRNVIFRIPTPVFGAGLIEQIPDKAILANQVKDAPRKKELKIYGRPNIVLAGHAISGQANKNGNDGTVARFGWKAQNKSLLLFSGEAYNVEMGITNELFQTERDETPTCQFAKLPNNVTKTDGKTLVEGISDIEKFAFFARLLAAPAASPDTPGGAESIARGRKLFIDTGCALCHTPTLNTGDAAVAALRNQPVNLFSDLLVHDMGPGLADGITQGQAGPREFRTAPLWGLGQRLFFLHDGRTSDLREAIRAHRSGSFLTFNASEANAVVRNFNRLQDDQKQDVLNFLRSL